MNRYKIAIIGYGKMGQVRHEAIRKINCGQVVAISEPNLSVKTNIPNLTHEEIIQNKEIDTIIICTPNFFNKDLTIRGLSAGKNIFCEKPPAFTESDIIEIQKVKW